VRETCRERLLPGVPIGLPRRSGEASAHRRARPMLGMRWSDHHRPAGRSGRRIRCRRFHRTECRTASSCSPAATREPAAGTSAARGCSRACRSGAERRTSTRGRDGSSFGAGGGAGVGADGERSTARSACATSAGGRSASDSASRSATRRTSGGAVRPATLRRTAAAVGGAPSRRRRPRTRVAAAHRSGRWRTVRSICREAAGHRCTGRDAAGQPPAVCQSGATAIHAALASHGRSVGSLFVRPAAPASAGSARGAPGRVRRHADSGTTADQSVPRERSERESQASRARARLGHRCVLSAEARRRAPRRNAQAAVSRGDQEVLRGIRRAGDSRVRREHDALPGRAERRARGGEEALLATAAPRYLSRRRERVSPCEPSAHAQDGSCHTGGTRDG
jgi:hypothetical protein